MFGLKLKKLKIIKNEKIEIKKFKTKKLFGQSRRSNRALIFKIRYLKTQISFGKIRIRCKTCFT